MFQGIFRGVLRDKGGLKEVQRFFNGVSKEFKGRFKDVSRKFQVCLKKLSSVCS